LKETRPSVGPTWRSVFYTALIYGGAALLFTLLGVLQGPTVAQIGTTRPADTIPGHLIELAVFGLLLAAVCIVGFGREGLPFVLLLPVLTLLLDIDHLPAYLGSAETIRPAHSLLFLAFVLAATAITIKALDTELVVASAFMTHMAIDTGLFAPWSPLSFQYIQLDPYRPIFAVGAVACAAAAGLVLRVRKMADNHGRGANNG